MDYLDLGILKTLLVNNGVPPPGHPVLKKSFRSMAKELGVDQGTIRKRMKRFQEKGVLRGWYLGINPGLTGQDVVYSWFEVENESEKEHVMERLLSLPDLERTCDYLGSKVKMVLLCDKGEDTDNVKRQLVRLVGSKALMRSYVFLEVPALRSTETDLAIIGSLRRDPWKPYPTIAKELGLSTRTVKRRTERLSEGGAIYLLPIIDLKALQGVIPVDLTVDYALKDLTPKVNEQVTAYVKDELMYSGKIGPRGYWAMMVPNVSRVEQMLRWVKRLEGVRDAQADILQDVVLNRGHFRKARLRRISETTKDQDSGLVKQAV